MKTKEEIQTQIEVLKTQEKTILGHLRELEVALDQNRQMLISVQTGITVLKDVLGEPDANTEDGTNPGAETSSNPQ